MFELKQYRRLIFDDAEEWCKLWRKTVLWFEKWRKKFTKFSREHLKVSKLLLWWGSSVQNRKRMSLKFTEILCVMTMNDDTIIEEKLPVVSKLIWGISQRLTWALKSLKNLHLNGLLVTKVYNIWAKTVQRSHVSWS